jgi:SAM-dependent methyltransferase
MLKVGASLFGVADRASAPARRRLAVTEFLLGDSSWQDRVVSGAYFKFAAPQWAQEQDGQDRLGPLLAGLATVPVIPQTICELGCGAGRSALEASLRWPEATVHAYDPSGPMIRAARRRSSGSGGSGRIVFTRKGLRDVNGPYDLVFMNNYLPNPRLVHALLRPGAFALQISSFEHRATEVVRSHWSACGFRSLAGADVGAGSFELFVATSVDTPGGMP